jgi:hypothetical protein
VENGLFLGMSGVECDPAPADNCNEHFAGVNQSADTFDYSGNSGKGERTMMSKLSYSLVLIGAIGAALVGSAAQAGETNVTGFYAAVPIDPVVVKKKDGSSVVMFGLKGVLIVDDQSNPWHGAMMDCNGIGAYAADGATQSEGGTCILSNGDGDVQRLPWQTTNAKGGTWNVAGGTGKFAKMTGNGTYVFVALADGRILNRWTFKQVTP